VTWKMMFWIAVGIASLVIWAEGTAGALRLLPIGLVFFWAAIAQWQDGPGKGPVSIVLVPGLVVFAFVGLFALAWGFNWAGTATGSSTSALALLFVPIWAVGVGAVVAVGVALIAPDPFGRARRRTSGCS
jgi:hypothetical protein